MLYASSVCTACVLRNVSHLFVYAYCDYLCVCVYVCVCVCARVCVCVCKRTLEVRTYLQTRCFLAVTSAGLGPLQSI